MAAATSKHAGDTYEYEKEHARSFHYAGPSKGKTLSIGERQGEYLEA